MRLFSLFFVFIFFVGCVASKSNMNTEKDKEFIEKIKKEKFATENVEEIFNDSKDYVIILHKMDRGTGFPSVIEFVVLDLATKKKIYEDSVIDGSVSWEDNDVIRIKRIPDARSKDDETNKKAELKHINVRKL